MWKKTIALIIASTALKCAAAIIEAKSVMMERSLK